MGSEIFIRERFKDAPKIDDDLKPGFSIDIKSFNPMIGMCAGLSMEGMRPFAYTISTFALYRPFEMVRNAICYQNLPVTIVGMGAGTIYSTLGGTHLTQEDISIARSIPNMNIIAPCDPNELEEAINYCSKKSKNPVYLRIGKVGEKNFTDKKSEKWKFFRFVAAIYARYYSFYLCYFFLISMG